VASPFTFKKKNLNAKEELLKFKYFTMQKCIILKKNPLKKLKNPSRYHNVEKIACLFIYYLLFICGSWLHTYFNILATLTIIILFVEILKIKKKRKKSTSKFQNCLVFPIGFRASLDFIPVMNGMPLRPFRNLRVLALRMASFKGLCLGATAFKLWQTCTSSRSSPLHKCGV
jgi:hypothetical protein